MLKKDPVAEQGIGGTSYYYLTDHYLARCYCAKRLCRERGDTPGDAGQAQIYMHLQSFLGLSGDG